MRRAWAWLHGAVIPLVLLTCITEPSIGQATGRVDSVAFDGTAAAGYATVNLPAGWDSARVIWRVCIEVRKDGKREACVYRQKTGAWVVAQPAPPPPPANAAPVARWTYSCSGADLNARQCAFDASASTDDRAVVSWRWDFGDGSIGLKPALKHTFPADGEYRVTLIVKDADSAAGALMLPVQVGAVSPPPPPDTTSPPPPPPPDSTGPPPPPPSGAYPNQPAGYRFVIENDASVKPVRGGTPWWHYDGSLAVVQTNRGAAWQTFQPIGMDGGVGSVNMGAVDWPDQRELYASFWFRFGEATAAGVGTTFESHPAGTKLLGFIANGQKGAANNQTILMLHTQTGSKTDFYMELRQQGIPQPNGQVTRNLGPNRTSGTFLRPGQWHHLELVLGLNAIGQANGTAKAWVDGRLVMDHANVTWRTAAMPAGFFDWKWNPTWGGSGGKRTQQDFIQIDHVYFSGVPCGAAGC